VRCGLSSGSGDQLCGPLAILLWSWVLAVLVYWGLVTLPCTLSLGQGQRSISQLSAVSILCWFVDCFSILQHCLALDVAHWFRRWVLWTAICHISGSSSSSACCQPVCLFTLCLLKVCTENSSLTLPTSLVQQLIGCLTFQALFTVSLCEDQLLAPLPFSGALSAPCPLCCMFLFSSLFIIQFCFFAGWGSVCPEGYAGLLRGGCGNTAWCLFAHLLVCISQAGLELVSGSMGALLFSQCNVAWRGFVRAGVSGVRVLLLLGGIFSAKCGSSISTKFLIYGAHAVCFLPLVTILDSPEMLFLRK
jgi:hypothetical protein